jgi:uncharacterized protein YkwD
MALMICKLNIRTTGKFIAAASLCGVVAACGGGGSDTAATTAAPGAASTDAVAPLPTPVATAASAPVAPATTSPATPTAATAGDFSCGLNGAAGIQAEILQRVNALRAAGAVCGTTPYPATTALNWNNQLLQAALGHSSDMAQKNYFSHTSQDGRTLGQRVTAAGYTWSGVGENIAAGQRSVEQVITGWTNSPGHCQNLMNANFRDVAVACVRNDAADYRLYWTMNLGRSR